MKFHKIVGGVLVLWPLGVLALVDPYLTLAVIGMAAALLATVVGLWLLSQD